MSKTTTLPRSSSTKGPILLLGLGLVAIVTVIKEEITEPLLYRTLRGEAAYGSRFTDLYIPPSLDAQSQRHLSLNLGGGNCKWQPPIYDIDPTLNLHKTLIVGFPSGDKRMIFAQMEALSALPAKDEWDFEFLGDSNHPFIKANYPHHEGIWGWGTNADQVVMMVRNMRRSMVEYHDILWDIGYAKTWEEATINLDKLYGERPPIEDFYTWRDIRVLDEIKWYSWHIDYWMENGLLRDIFTHKTTTFEHWTMLMQPTIYTREELDYNLVVGNETVVPPTYDPHCANGDVTSGCEPVAIISAEKLRDPNEGKDETTRIANVLLSDERMAEHVIDSQAWNCIWRELIQNGKGLKTVYDRPGFVESDYDFSAEMLDAMLVELDYLINKYSGSEWNSKPTANRLVELITEHRQLIQIERNQVNSNGNRLLLRDQDFLGPKERERRRQLKLVEEGKSADVDDVKEKEKKKDFSRYFQAIEVRLLEKKRRNMRDTARKIAAERGLGQRNI